VISALSIHHFKDEDKQRVYEKCHTLLNQGGEFLNADQVAAGSSSLDQRYRDIHAQFVRNNTNDVEYEQFLKNISLDLRAPMPAQLDWLKAAGFTQTDCVFKWNCFAVMYAVVGFHRNARRGIPDIRRI